MKKALIAGATGAIGTKLLKLLDTSDLYSEIHYVGRRKPAISSDKIKVHIVCTDELTTLTLEESIDDVFCTVGTTIKVAGSVENFKKVDRDYVYLIGKLAMRQQAKTCSVVSAINADSSASNFYNQTKGETEELLKSLSLTSLRIFRPSLLHGGRDVFRLNENIGHLLLILMRPILIGSWKKYRAIHVEQVAKAMFESAQQSNPKIKVFESNEIQEF